MLQREVGVGKEQAGPTLAQLRATEGGAATPCHPVSPRKAGGGGVVHLS
jgi:hypothetical protein